MKKICDNYWCPALVKTTLLIVALFVIFFVQGCTTAEQLKEHEFTNGCLVLEAGINLGYLNQEGKAEVCKLKCSPLLPDNFSYHYENQRTGCKVEVGNASK